MGSSGWLRMFAPGSSVDYQRQAGVIYDNSVVSIALTRIPDWSLPPPRSRGIRSWAADEEPAE